METEVKENPPEGALESVNERRMKGLPRAAAIWLALVALLIGLQLLPVRSGIVKIALVAVTLAVWIGAIRLLRMRPLLRWTFVAVPLVGLAVLALPGRAADSDALRLAYVRSLSSYRGALYVWGGETSLGIDCSGLIRRALIDACLAEGWRTRNPGLFRQVIALWWKDCSAAELGRGWKGRLDQVATATNLNGADYESLMPGDVAVTANGLHTLAYMGDHTWIQADPGAWRVITTRAPDANMTWFKVPIRLMRWRMIG